MCACPEIREVPLPPGSSLPFDEADWRGALVVVERGPIELERPCGARWRCETGAMLWLEGMSLVALHNRGPGAALLVAASREPRDRRHPL